MKYFVLFALSMTVYFNSYAHSPFEAFFSISQSKDSVLIKAEFPWTLRNALLAFSPDLVNAKNSQDFEKAFVDYIKKNIVLTDTKGATMPFVYFKVFETNGHSHESNYLLVFRGSGIREITNTTMFDHSEKQINYHYLLLEQTKLEFQTTLEHPSFVLREAGKFSYWYLCLLIPLVVFYLLKKRRIQ